MRRVGAANDLHINLRIDIGDRSFLLHQVRLVLECFFRVICVLDKVVFLLVVLFAEEHFLFSA